MQKDPASTLDFAVDWTQWLAQGETITASTWAVDTGITKGADSFTGTRAVVWLSGGTARKSYKATNHITTSQARQDERTVTIDVFER